MSRSTLFSKYRQHLFVPTESRQLLRRLIPYSLRVEVARMKHMPQRLSEWKHSARTKASVIHYPYVLSESSSVLHRELADTAPALIAGKEKNIRIVASKINRVVIQPGQIFSYHALVGRPSMLRGFRSGLELHNETMATGIGGGACKVTNLIYQLALNAGMVIVERHRHSLDLFPDKNRKVPFGLGATVFYNYADLQFLNPHQHAVQICINIKDGAVNAAFTSDTKLPWTIEVYEQDHRFVPDKSGFIRENKIRRRYRDEHGAVLRDELIASNKARVLYQPNLALNA